MDHIIDLPVPPLCADHPDNAIRRGERIVIELIDGRKLIGRLMKFDADKGHIAVDLEGADKHKNLGMHELRLLRIPQPRPWHNDTDLGPGDDAPPAMRPLEFNIEFCDHSTIDGMSFGFRNGRHGIHLFPVQDADQYTHLFIPNNAIARHRIGKQLVRASRTPAAEHDDAVTVLEYPEQRAFRPTDDLATGNDHKTARLPQPQRNPSGAAIGREGGQSASALIINAIESAAADATAFLRTLLNDALRSEVTAIHFESSHAGGARIRLRRDGELREHGTVSAERWPHLLARLKAAAGLDSPATTGACIAQLDTTFLRPLALQAQLYVIATRDGGHDVVLKITAAAHAHDFADLGFDDDLVRRIDACAAARASGLFLVCSGSEAEAAELAQALLLRGNTGRNKVWTLASAGGALPPDVRRVTPPAGHETDISQAIETLLGADADLIMIGRLADSALARRVVGSALAGPRLIATLPARNSGEAVERLINMGVPRYELADALSLVVMHSHARKLCSECSQAQPLSNDDLDHLVNDYLADTLSLDDLPAHTSMLREATRQQWRTASAAPTVRRAVGCRQCQGSGYQGRTVLHEALEITAPVRRAILDGADARAITQAAIGAGMRTLRQHGIQRALQGDIDLVQARAASPR